MGPASSSPMEILFGDEGFVCACFSSRMITLLIAGYHK